MYLTSSGLDFELGQPDKERKLLKKCVLKLCQTLWTSFFQEPVLTVISTSVMRLRREYSGTKMMTYIVLKYRLETSTINELLVCDRRAE